MNMGRDQAEKLRRYFINAEPFVWREKREDNLPIPLKEPAHIFLQINTQWDYVERWTVFGGLWFEEIEPWIRESASKNEE